MWSSCLLAWNVLSHVCLWTRCERPVCCHEMSSPFGMSCPLVVAIKCHVCCHQIVIVSIRCACCHKMSRLLPSNVKSVATSCHVYCHQMSRLLPSNVMFVAINFMFTEFMPVVKDCPVRGAMNYPVCYLEPFSVTCPDMNYPVLFNVMNCLVSCSEC